MLQIQPFVNPQSINAEDYSFRTTRNIFQEYHSSTPFPPINLHCSTSISSRNNATNFYFHQSSPIVSYIHNNIKIQSSKLQESSKFSNFNYGLHVNPGLRTPSTYACLSCDHVFNTDTLASSPREDGPKQGKDTLHYRPQTL